MLKELLFTGVGTAVLLREKVEQELKKLEETGKLKSDDTKSFLQNLEQKGKDEELRAKEEIKKILKEILDELGVATKEDIEKLKESLK